ncbi:hypothetical protein L3556_10360 [Candidatus Synechococcus calcipolaris G9]|uniref:Proton extrusion protein PcxA n=1 Tax=Candidatus Synechococcus calcipolaris G9 TaxID=1497997 RepID=A0ABT6F0K4_9SYNE|nr:hypothetical protein [Candidatus Synechococcus calcipolaris]MDG2991328.1 hypothetical protein [Candidatus Synechococcus calcipolaris G9]
MLNRWFSQWQLRALEKAYQGAIALKEIEDKYFNGEPVAYDAQMGQTVSDYLQSRVEQQLTKIHFNLNQFKLSGWLQNTTNDPHESEILAKLGLIEMVIAKYRQPQPTPEIDPPPAISTPVPTAASSEPVIITDPISKSSQIIPMGQKQNSQRLFGSFLDRAAQIRRELNPEYEQDMVRELRSLRKQQTIAIRWLILLVAVPLIVQITTRNLIFEPLLDAYWNRSPNPAEIVANAEISEEFLHEFSNYKDSLEIAQLLGITPNLAPEKREELLRERATELFQEAGYRTLDGLKNIFADLLGLASFVLLVYLGRKELIVVRQFISRTFLGLNDATKIFLIILITDLFVGYHSPEGWDVVLGGLYRHFGLVENHTAINAFIATVPVFMDSWFKFWVFNYLTRSSPSSVAIYEKMNQ